MHSTTDTSPEPPDSGTETACLGYLELLTRGAPAEAYDDPRPSAGAGPSAERGKQLALRIRAELEARRRREAELTALFETVHDLAGLRDLDDVLQAIVQRARRLLGTEVAYMTLNDPARGDTYMRVTEGSVSARFQQLRLGMGEGLGGLVAQTARPYATQDYPRDARFQHTDAIDRGVGEEGLIAILGVPLLLGGREVIGVLYAADRRERVFEPEQIALLRSFAAHAAVALDNTRLLTETTQALAGLRAVNETIRRASDVHDRLTELVLRGGGVDEVTRVLTEVLGHRVEFTERAGRPEAGTGIGPGTRAGAETAEAALASAVERSRRDGHAVRQGDAWVAAVTAGGELLGALLLHGHPELDPVDQRTLERAAMVTSLLQLARRSAGEAEQRVRGELLDDLLDAAHRDPHLLHDRAARVGADLDVPHTVLAARLDASRGPAEGPPDEADRQRLWSAATHLAATRHGLAATRDGGPVLLLPLQSTPDDSEGAVSYAARQVAAELGRAVGGPVTVGASAPVPPPAAHPGSVAAAYPEARRCLEALTLLGRRGEGAAAGDLGFLGLLLTDSRDVTGFVRRTLGPALDYDERRGTELVATLDAYFASGMSPVRAKDALHVHVNTVAQRLERVARLLGDDWQAPHRALEIQLALRLHRLTGALGG
ncbi:GAF domain-containing protein [Streptomyces sp. 891-h]|uniref:helix-turn-helix domain-containing protein n=1 Tax=Streptomyces sp. 891-h TaxID=2720714 RepID=UPI001FA99498|nr:GAF domain-containing protein [Streptomyces sp. 891-h]UNZ18626.1 GAF domain-containing protein [Streptomyces sp. 891-h]